MYKQGSTNFCLGAFAKKLKHFKPSFYKLTPNCGKMLTSCCQAVSYNSTFAKAFPSDFNISNNIKKIEKLSSSARVTSTEYQDIRLLVSGE